jgi:activating signal cointegrator complex subunit 3
VLSSVAEFDELPVRHNEDRINAELAHKIVESGGWKVDTRTAEDPHTKANLLFQAHFLRLELPLSDYITDTKNVLDQSIRIMQAMVDVMADQGWLESTLRCMNLTQMLVQGRLITDSSLMTLPHIDKQEAIALERSGYSCLPVLADAVQQDDHGAHRCLKQLIGSESKAKQAIDACRRIPLVQPTCHLNDKKSDSNEAQVNVRITNAGAAKRPQRLTQAYCPRYGIILDSLSECIQCETFH